MGVRLVWFIKVSQSIHVPAIEVTKGKEPNRADIKTKRQTAGWSLRFGFLGFILGGELDILLGAGLVYQRYSHVLPLNRIACSAPPAQAGCLKIVLV